MFSPSASPELNRAFRTLSVCLDRRPSKMSRTEAQKIFEWMRVAQNTDGAANVLFRQASRTYGQLVNTGFVEDAELTSRETEAFQRAESGAGTSRSLLWIASAVVVAGGACLVWWLSRR